MRILTVALTLLFLVSFMSAQDFEYGNPSELKGLKRAFIDVGPDVKNFNRIKDEIDGAKLPGFEIVSDVDVSDFVILFRGDKGVEITGDNSYRRDTGKGYVGIRSRDIVLISFDEMQDKLFEKKPAIKFTREFIKAYKKANGLK